MGILPNCKDPTLKALKSIGYNVVQLPRVDLYPTQLLVSENKRLKRLGELSSVFTAGLSAPPVPPVSADRPGPSIQITKSAALDLGVGLNILGGLISALGGSTLGLNLAYSKAHKIELEYSGTLENSAQLALIDQFLAGATVNPFATATKQMLEADMVYVVTSTLKSNKLTVKATDHNKQSVGIDVPVLAQAVGGNLKVTGSGATSTTVTFEGNVPLGFAFQAVKLIFDQGKYRSMKLIDGGGAIAEAVGGDSDDTPAMIDDDLLLRG
jgi:hypothetical protein